MLSIQQVGTEILSGQPRQFYVMTGPEYGIKCNYIDKLTQHFGNCIQASSVNELLSMFSVKRLIPPSRAVYVVRYDDDFITSLNESSSARISNAKISGTIVCIYEGSKYDSKLSKYLGDYTVHISPVDKKFMIKYLHSEFSNLPDRLISEAVDIATSYGHSRAIARMMSYGDVNALFELPPKSIGALFGVSTSYDDSAVKLGVASRNFYSLMKILDNYEGDYSRFIYSALSAMISLESVIGSRYSSSEFSRYGKLWTRKDIYNFFMNAYAELKKLRTYTYDGYYSVVYLISLLQFKEIPDVGDMV